MGSQARRERRARNRTAPGPFGDGDVAQLLVLGVGWLDVDGPIARIVASRVLTVL
jgi:hypothetical protein